MRRQYAPEGLRIEPESFRSSRSRAITLGSKDAVARHNTRCEVADVLEGGALGRHNDVGQQRVRPSMAAMTGTRRLARFSKTWTPSSWIWLHTPGPEAFLNDDQSTPIMKSPPAP